VNLYFGLNMAHLLHSVFVFSLQHFLDINNYAIFTSG